MTNTSKKPIIDGDRVFKATNVKIKTLHPIFLGLAQNLSSIVMLRFIKIYDDRLCASNLLSTDGKKEPIVETKRTNLVGVELLVDPAPPWQFGGPGGFGGPRMVFAINSKCSYGLHAR